MDLLTLLRIMGWVMALLPFLTFMAISIAMVRGVGKDDPMIAGIATFGLTIFLIGVVILILTYLTNFLQ